MNREETLYKDFSARMLPRLLWASSEDGTAIRVVDDKGRIYYRAKPVVVKRKHRLTEAEDNAIGRAHRRRTNRGMRGWLPFAKR